jgi:hypothetical protein
MYAPITFCPVVRPAEAPVPTHTHCPSAQPRSHTYTSTCHILERLHLTRCFRKYYCGGEANLVSGPRRMTMGKATSPRWGWKRASHTADQVLENCAPPQINTPILHWVIIIVRLTPSIPSAQFPPIPSRPESYGHRDPRLFTHAAHPYRAYFLYVHIQSANFGTVSSNDPRKL